MAIKQNLTLIQGDSKTYNLTFTDADGAVIIITNWTIYFTVKRSYADADIDAVLQKTVTVHTDPTQGKTAIVLEYADTKTLPVGVYYYSIQVKTSGDKYYTLMKGNYRIEEVADRNS